jgi:hypothetical protein
VKYVLPEKLSSSINEIVTLTDKYIMRTIRTPFLVLLLIGGFIALLAPQAIQAQGTVTYLSNLGQTSTGSVAVGSDSWLAVNLITGINAGGYVLNSVQLAMTDASGNPSGFSVMLYSMKASGAVGSSLGTLNGSLNPVTSGIFAYSPASSITLTPHTDYYLVLTAATAVANGAYDWSLSGTYSYNPSDGWGVGSNEGTIGIYGSSLNGLSWNLGNQGNLQFAVNATPIPEPGVLSLSALSSLVFLWQRRKAAAAV